MAFRVIEKSEEATYYLKNSSSVKETLLKQKVSKQQNLNQLFGYIFSRFG